MSANFLGRRIRIGSHAIQVEKTIAEGGFGVVYLARDDQAKPLVLKQMYVQGPENAKQLQQEVQVMRTLQHEHIVRYFGHASSKQNEDTTLVLVLMEYCPGGNLLDVINTCGANSLTISQVLKYFIPIARAVAYLHQQEPPIAHRDLKLENILISSNGTLKLCDFGSISTHSGVLSDKLARVEQEDIIERFTTPQYRAPEMIDLYCNEPLDERVDIWALGCMLYSIMYQVHPFQEVGPLGILSGKYSFPTRAHDFPAQLKDLVCVCFQHSPRKRPTAKTIVSYCEALLSSISKSSRIPNTSELPQLCTKDNQNAIAMFYDSEAADLEKSFSSVSMNRTNTGNRSQQRNTRTRLHQNMPSGTLGEALKPVKSPTATATAAPSGALQRRLKQRGEKAQTSSNLATTSLRQGNELKQEQTFDAGFPEQANAASTKQIKAKTTKQQTNSTSHTPQQGDFDTFDPFSTDEFDPFGTGTESESLNTMHDATDIFANNATSSQTHHQPTTDIFANNGTSSSKEQFDPFAEFPITNDTTGNQRKNSIHSLNNSRANNSSNVHSYETNMINSNNSVEFTNTVTRTHIEYPLRREQSDSAAHVGHKHLLQRRAYSESCVIKDDLLHSNKEQQQQPQGQQGQQTEEEEEDILGSGSDLLSNATPPQQHGRVSHYNSMPHYSSSSRPQYNSSSRPQYNSGSMPQYNSSSMTYDRTQIGIPSGTNTVYLGHPSFANQFGVSHGHHHYQYPASAPIHRQQGHNAQFHSNPGFRQPKFT